MQRHIEPGNRRAYTAAMSIEHGPDSETVRNSPANEHLASVEAAEHDTAKDQTPQQPSARTWQLLAVSFAIALLFDRLVLNGLTNTYGRPDRMTQLLAIFWLICVTAATALHWRTARTRPFVWFIDAAITALGYWMVTRGVGIYTGDPVYGLLTGTIAVPSLLMLHAQSVNGRYDIRHPLGLALRWATGWIVQPFIGLGAFSHAIVGITHAAVHDRRRSIIRRTAMALCIAVPLLMAMTALLMNADMVFSYAVTHVIGDIDLSSFVLHALLVLIASPLLFSLLHQQDRTDGRVAALYERSLTLKMDSLVMTIVLGLLLAVYALFCAVQFSFLFAREGLPGGLTYAEYARSGFFQLLVVASVNLVLFGAGSTYARRTRTLTVMLVGLIATTAIMLVSAAMRLGLYIAAYGLTWLRFTSMAFIALLTAVLILCAAKMCLNRMPLIMACFALFVIWYVAIGYCDVPTIVTTYNLSHGFGMA